MEFNNVIIILIIINSIIVYNIDIRITLKHVPTYHKYICINIICDTYTVHPIQYYIISSISFTMRQDDYVYMN